MKKLKVGGFCHVDGEGLEVFMIIEETLNSFVVMSLDTSSYIYNKSNCSYVNPNRITVHSKPYWITSR